MACRSVQVEVAEMYGQTDLLAGVGRQRVLTVRRQLAMGEYDVDDKLTAVLDRLLDYLIAESEPGEMGKTKDNPTDRIIRILVVDDHAIVRQGLTRLVEAQRDLSVCAEAENAAQALEAIERQQFDLAIVDISLEDANGLELTAQMKSRCPGMTILILSMYDGLLYARRALQAGAAGYVAKYEAPEKVISAIHRVLSGQVYVSNSKTARTMHGAASVVAEDLNSSRAGEIDPPGLPRHGVPNHASS